MADNFFANSEDDSPIQRSFQEDSVVLAFFKELEIADEGDSLHAPTMSGNHSMPWVLNPAPAPVPASVPMTTMVAGHTGSTIRPVRYDYSQPELYPAFRSYVELKHRYDHMHFNGAGAYILHCYSLLSGSALLQVQPFVSGMARDVRKENVDEFLRFLDSCFEDTVASDFALVPVPTFPAIFPTAPAPATVTPINTNLAANQRISPSSFSRR
ncbi:uncharacterized protein BROUX77_003370 [Berkeleyomyces rouxiae]|uniref:uncharacterized protein n=1 Tax=Berkeleyomyces rouxiae TaxID=2035830 RepID=UPI003B785A56